MRRTRALPARSNGDTCPIAIPLAAIAMIFACAITSDVPLTSVTGSRITSPLVTCNGSFGSA